MRGSAYDKSQMRNMGPTLHMQWKNTLQHRQKRFNDMFSRSGRV